MTPSSLQILIPILVLVPVLYLRIRRISRAQPLKLSQLWVRPAMIIAVCALVLLMPQPGQPVVRHLSAADYGWLALAALLGGLAGWRFGRTMAIETHPEDGTLMVKGGQAAILAIIVLVMIRMALKVGLAAEAQVWHLDAILISDASLIFTAALFTVRAVEMYLRAKKVMGRAAA